MAKKFNPDDVERWVTVKGARIPIMKDGSFGVGTTAKGDKVVVVKDDLVDSRKKAKDEEEEEKYKQKYNMEWSKKWGETYLQHDTDEELNEAEKNLQKDLDRYMKDGMSIEAKHQTYGMLNAIALERKRRNPNSWKTGRTTSRNARYDTSKAIKKNIYEGKSVAQLQSILKNLRAGASITGTSEGTARQIAEIEQEIAKRKKK